MGGVTIFDYLSGPNGVTEKIKLAMYEVAKSFVYIGFLLWEVQEYRYYVTTGYKDVYDYAQQELGFKRTSTKNFINVATVFGNKYYKSEVASHAFLPTMQLKPEYKDFNYSQLVEMLSMSDKKRSQVTPNMTVRQIRELKKEPEFELEPDYETVPLELPDVQPVGQTSDRVLSYSLTFDRAEWEIIVDNLEDNIKYNDSEPGELEVMRRIVDEIRGVIRYST